jgi:HK97 gp10 family phage protein
MTLDELDDLLTRTAIGTRPRSEETLIAYGVVAKEAARELIGHEHDGGPGQAAGAPSWPELKPSTIADKERKGYAVPDPLLRTGQLRDSIDSLVEGLTMSLGSHDKRARWFEEGTSKMPPRPFIAPAIRMTEQVAAEMFQKAIANLLLQERR